MEKIKLTQEQADAISKLLKKMTADRLIDTHIKQIWKEEYDALNYMEVSKVARAVLVGYEVIPQYKVGEWVVNIHSGEIGQVEAFTNVKGSLGNSERIIVNNVVNYPDSFRHATPEEIQQEKKRQFWDKLGREVDEYKAGDVVSVLKNKRSITFLNTYELENSKVSFPGNAGYYSLKDIRLVTPVEQRLDK